MAVRQGVDMGSPGAVAVAARVRLGLVISTVTPVPPPAPTPPTLSNLTPAAGTPIAPDTPLQFDITDADGFAIIIPMIQLDDFSVPEPVARGVLGVDFAFEPRYQALSIRTSITNGYRYTLRRAGGWTASPRLRLWAVDAQGAVWIGP